MIFVIKIASTYFDKEHKILIFEEYMLSRSRRKTIFQRFEPGGRIIVHFVQITIVLHNGLSLCVTYHNNFSFLIN